MQFLLEMWNVSVLQTQFSNPIFDQKKTSQPFLTRIYLLKCIINDWTKWINKQGGFSFMDRKD